MSRNQVRLNFPQTCPDIDKSLKVIHAEIAYHIDDLIRQINDSEYTPEIYEKYVNWLYDAVASEVEEVRQTNSKLRDAAESQLSQMQEEIDDLKDETYSLGKEIDRLQNYK